MGRSFGPSGLVVVSCLATLTILWPAVFAVQSMIGATPLEPGSFEVSALWRTVVWAIVVAIVSIPLGLLGATALARILRGVRGARLACALSVLPLCLPGYAVFWCWWQSFGPGSQIGAWAVRNDSVLYLREGVLLLALVCWSWPLIAWPLALARCHRANASLALAALDRAPWSVRQRLRLRTELPALALGLVLVAFITAGATVSFDLAQVATIGFELRALDATGVPAGALFRLALPSVIVAVVGALVLVGLLRGSSSRWGAALSLRGTQAGSTLSAWVILLLLVGSTLALPLGLAFVGMGGLDPGLFWTLHAGATMRTLFGALFDGVLGALLAGALFVQMVHGGRTLRVLGLLLAALFIGAALLPSIVVSAAMTSAFNRAFVGPLLYDSGGALVLGHLARTGGLAAAIALFFALTEARAVRAQRSLDPPSLRANAPRLKAAAVIAFAVSAVYSLGELVISARLAPPGDARIATSLLNAMHYQQPDTVLIALIGLLAAAIGLAIVVAFLAPRRVAMPGTGLVLLLSMLILPACNERPAPLVEEDDSLVPSEILVGAPGRGPGLFNFPRGIALDDARDRFYVVDKSARVQRFASDGTFEIGWPMPESDVGKPVGISVSPDGRVFVPDTHYNRIVVFDPEGNELMRFGSFGTEPGQFVYPTDIAFGPDGNIYVAEYGSNDRVQVFDAEGRFLRQFGSFGREDGMFARPQSIVISPEAGELYIADSCNHRISVHSLEGEWLRSLGAPGRGPGELAYPYGLELLPDGSLLVSEMAGDRVQRLDVQTGASLGTWGGAGFTRGRLHIPWGVASDGERLYVLDSGNARVQVGPLPSAKP